MPEMLELLLVEDDPAIVSTLSDFYNRKGFPSQLHPDNGRQPPCWRPGVFIWLCWTSL